MRRSSTCSISLKRLKNVLHLYPEQISDPEVIADHDTWRDYCREHSELSPIIEEYHIYQKAIATVEDDREMLESEDDKELAEMLREGIDEAKRQAEESEERLKLLLIPKDPNDEKNVIMEIRGGTGGEEAALFGSAVS